MGDAYNYANRGPYKKYLTDNSIDIPSSTLRSRSISRMSMQDLTCQENTVNNDCLNNSEEPLPQCNIVENFEDFDDNESILESNSNDENDSCKCTDSSNDVESISEDELYNENPFYDSDEENAMDSDENDKDHLPIYEMCDISRQESELLIMSYALRHNLPDVALDNILRIIDCHLPSSEYKSKYRFLKSFELPTLKYCYYCVTCSELIYFQGETFSCDQCSTVYRKLVLKRKGQYFINIPLEHQLKDLLNSKVYTYLRKSSNDEYDIVNGQIYKQLREKNIIKDNDISITFNTDGISPFKSSNYSIWPIQVTINELPYRIRKNNVILCGLWCGYNKPIMNLFLKPFVEELIHLSKYGFQTTTALHLYPIPIKVHTILCSVDSVARPLLQNINQYNGKFGCGYCFNEGQQIHVGRGTARIYQFEEIKLRSRVLHNKLVRMAVDKKSVVKGVKGPSVTLLVPYLDIVHSYPPEYMHSCLLGVAKLFLTEWFDSKNSNERWYLGSYVNEFNKRILAIKPPCEISRTPQIVTDKYKANQYKQFILYYSLPSLYGLMPERYYKHWFLFVYSLHIYLKTKCTDEELHLAKTALYKFVKDICTLYDKRFMKYNVHILLHIPMFVKNYGALWSWSAFPYETYNGIIKKLFHGTQWVPEQVCKMYFRLRFVINNSHIFENPNCSEKVITTFTTIMNQCRVKNCIEYGDHLRIFGKSNLRKLTVTEKVVIETLIHVTVEESVEIYNKFIYKNTSFHSSQRNRFIRRSNHYILTNNNDILSISYLAKVTLAASKEIMYIVIGMRLCILNEQLCKYEKISSKAFSFIAQQTNNIIVCEPCDIKTKCVSVPYKEDRLCLLPIVNKVETD